MRLWTLHPGYLDAKGLTAVWREGLLAQKVLAGGTQGYTRHPQLARFRAHPRPLQAVAAFLHAIANEARRRGYRFDTTRILRKRFSAQIEESSGQLLYEWRHLRRKLRMRAPHIHRQLRKVTVPNPHPLFRIVPGEVKDWEKR